MAVHEMSQRLGNAGPAAIFELQHDTTRDIAIGDGGAGTVIFRRMGEAGAAFGIGGAGGRPQRMQQGSPRKCRSCQQLRQKRRTASATTPNWRSRSDERRVGNEWVSTCRFGWAPYH